MFQKIYTCLVNPGVIVIAILLQLITAVLFKLFISIKPVFHTDIFGKFSKIDMYGLLYIMTCSL